MLTEKVESELSSNPLVAAFPSSAVHEDVVLFPGTVDLSRRRNGRRRRRRRHRDVSNEIVDESKIFRRQLQGAFQLRIENVDLIFFDVDDHVGESFLLLEQNVCGADDVSGNAWLRQGVHVRQGKVGMTQVAAGEDFERKVQVFVRSVRDVARIRKFEFDSFFKTFFVRRVAGGRVRLAACDVVESAGQARSELKREND